MGLTAILEGLVNPIRVPPAKSTPKKEKSRFDSPPNKDSTVCALAFRPRFLRFQQPIQFQSVSVHRLVYPD